ncbi:MAG: FixH family protein [Neisseriaceae bacterium]|nr:FixH family protein [Neisseriaceae bacterium]
MIIQVLLIFSGSLKRFALSSQSFRIHGLYPFNTFRQPENEFAMSTTDNNQNNQQPPRPWYKEPWVWGIIAGPAIVVVAGFITLGYALSVKDSLVTDDYYKEGKNIILEVERDKSAAQHHLSAQVYIQPNLDGAMVILDGEYDNTRKLTLTFFHNLQENDLTVELLPPENNGKQYTVKFPKPLADGKNWTVRLEDDAGQWRLEKRWNTEKEKNAFQLTPKYQEDKA